MCFQIVSEVCEFHNDVYYVRQLFLDLKIIELYCPIYQSGIKNSVIIFKFFF